MHSFSVKMAAIQIMENYSGVQTYRFELACLDLQSYIRDLTVHFGLVNMKIKLSMLIYYYYFVFGIESS
jgi:hypothetical protein